jgi:hypothetical protein
MRKKAEIEKRYFKLMESYKLPEWHPERPTNVTDWAMMALSWVLYK